MRAMIKVARHFTIYAAHSRHGHQGLIDERSVSTKIRKAAKRIYSAKTIDELKIFLKGRFYTPWETLFLGTDTLTTLSRSP
ncbi:MAG: hypothetical protein A2626_01010 [Candidatus Nealsonbacteria bacterium RIFCSPHIGHO2_01_FULL_38_55]|nr:MAG: hypothetical protein A2626_01010 [Candidatus Nealsonbacteria bacterium RIFCSPHIGHO2_01_FULL_38_55]OGZ22241.1 MAG: hypothetical protein A3C48_01640 [Candidatus Nealsonbacteria bacterium RIFCSPHIGHO2_02_FULL_38_75]OGZ22576.1 MAG: hypothetical protein A3E18_01945 [Candidatus Nealsonbacteria bacterium RIFCSPHIGHO2_12_FULL_38_18]OGZ25186.1 MAG: hypothetical protein A3I85_02640 [Candidatus Nealsonbacteria bacterium RIFCSPLOWO2_02_FULL_38_63]